MNFTNKIDFDAVQDNYSTLPEGEYLAVIDGIGKYVFEAGYKRNLDEANEPETSDAFLELKFNIVTDEYKGKVHFESLRLWSDNKIAANIAQATFKNICKALNVDHDSGSFSDLIGKPMVISLKHSKNASKKDGSPYVNIGKIKACARNDAFDDLEKDVNIEDEDVPMM